MAKRYPPISPSTDWPAIPLSGARDFPQVELGLEFRVKSGDPQDQSVFGTSSSWLI